jgi:hypothetical protein
MLEVGDTRDLPDGQHYAAADPAIVAVTGNRIRALANGDTLISAVAADGKKTPAAHVTVGWPVQNPVLPFTWNLYVPDDEAHNFGGTVYIYGSLDANDNSYCSPFYLSLFSQDIRHWESKGISFSSLQDNVPNRGRRLWDSDGFFDKRSRRFLHYGFFADTGNGKNNFMFVLDGDSPTGPFSNFRWLVGDKSGDKTDGISAQVFEDSDGSRYVTYAPTAHVHPWGNHPVIARLRDAATIDEASATNIGAALKDFYEGPSLRKRGDTYYFVYAENTGRITPQNRRPVRLSYATAKNIFGPYTYRGVILSIEKMQGESNIQGSIEEHNGQWYVFYHRSPNGIANRRALCAEKIDFGKDGLIAPILPTSSGVADALSTGNTLHAGTAVIFKNIRRGEFGAFGGVKPANDSEALIGFRYVKFTGKERKITLQGQHLENLKNLKAFADDRLIATGEGSSGATINPANFQSEKATLTLSFENEKSEPAPVIESVRFE